MEKQLSPFAAKALFKGAMFSLKVQLPGWFEDLPEDHAGVPVKLEDVEQALERIEDFAYEELEGLFGEIPDVPDTDPVVPTDPVSNEITVPNTGAVMYWNGEPYDKFVFKKVGPDYTKKSFEIEFADGNLLRVPNPNQMTMTGDNMKYQPGGRYSGNNPDIPTMEVYARKGTHPEWVKAVFRHAVDDSGPAPPVTPEPEPTDWTRIDWGGKDPDPDHDRRWWSCTDHPCRVWVRQFELPTSFPRSGSANFRFSNGYEGRVPDLSAKTKYLDHVAGSGRAVKYVKGQPDHPYIHDRKSDIAAPEGIPVTWMEYKVR